MINAINKSIVYVSNLGSDKISVLNGEISNVIDEIEVGPRPYELVVDNRDNIYIATDRNDRVTIINHITRTSKSLYMPNNGHIKLDSISQRIYVSNIEEVCIYSLDDNKILNKINGFIAVDGIEISSDGSKLFILDIFKNELSIYDTLTLENIKTYKNIGDSPNYIFIGPEDRYLYILNKGINKKSLSGKLIMIDIYTDKISYIEFPNGSILSSIDGNYRFLYVINTGLNRVEVIDILKGSIVGNFKTSLKDPQKTKLLKDHRYVLATSKDDKGRGALDIIDIENQKIVSTYNFQEKNSQPYSICIIEENNSEEEDLLYKNSNDRNLESQGNFILANKVLSTYKEKIIFQQEKIELISKEKIDIEDIKFENCKIIKESKNKELIINKENYIAISFEFNIPYYVECTNSKKEKLIIKGNLTGKQKAILYIEKSQDYDLNFTVKSSSEIISFPYIKDNNILFDVSSTISTYATKEELIYVPFKEINNNLEEV
ncbi:YncE family protein [Clostridium sp. AL.422]|uniref:YncE family protein n=1 Tax=Clostridium TaxID=1485 RepID=UPI00293DECE2|nr:MULTISPECIES: YncE family protein [unclassified Clostridium]MDV4151109.1 YncE family protein [Clostridium sp. AL.422]